MGVLRPAQAHEERPAFRQIAIVAPPFAFASVYIPLRMRCARLDGSYAPDGMEEDVLLLAIPSIENRLHQILRHLVRNGQVRVFENAL